MYAKNIIFGSLYNFVALGKMTHCQETADLSFMDMACALSSFCTRYGDSEQVLNDSLEVEWSKSYAQKKRWEEEVLLIQEEMRTIVYHEWRTWWWRNQRGHVDATTLHGIDAYAEQQAYLSESLASSSAAYWLLTLKSKGISPEWEACYSIMPTTDEDDIDDVGDDEGSEEIDDRGEVIDLVDSGSQTCLKQSQVYDIIRLNENCGNLYLTKLLKCN